MSAPPLPENAYILHADGRVTPLELVYLGRDAEGIHQWRATLMVPLAGGDRMRVDALPPRTRIICPVVTQ